MDQNEKLKRVRRLAWWLDESIPIPGTSFRVGFEAILGLIPGVGDFLGYLLGSIILWQSFSMGASNWLILRMLGNLVFEWIVGSVPLLGDAFDFVWKANLMNYRLLEAEVRNPAESAKRSQKWAFLLVVFWTLGSLTILGSGLLLLHALYLLLFR